MGAIVTSTMHGRCRVLEVETRVCNTRLMRFIMSTPIDEIQCRRIWHIVRAYHRCVMLSIPSESIAETVGSVLRDAAVKASGRPKSVDVFVRAAHIRMAGLRGHGGEEGVLSDALNVHFAGSSPEGWHFLTRNPASQSTSVVIAREERRRDIRLQHRPSWIWLPLRQAAASDFRLCKVLPRPDIFFAARSGEAALASGSSSLAARSGGPKSFGARKEGTQQARRASYNAFQQEHNPEQLPPVLWRSMGSSVASIAVDRRPGAHGR